MGKGLFIGAEMTQRPLSPKPTPVWVEIAKAGNPEHTAPPAGSSTGWRASFPSILAGLYFLQGADLFQPLLGSSACLIVSLHSAVLADYICLGLVYLVSFRDFLKLELFTY